METIIATSLVFAAALVETRMIIKKKLKGEI